MTSGLVVLGSAGSAVYKVIDDSRSPAGLTWCLTGIALVAVVGFVANVLDAREADNRASAKNQALDLTGCLHVLRASVNAAAGLPPDHDALRVTIHRHESPPTGQPGMVVQLVDYVGGRPTGHGRRMSDRAGIVGRAITTAGQRPWSMHRKANESFQEYVAVLTESYGMTREEAQRVTMDRMSFLAIPLSGGVVYLDSSLPDFFQEHVVAHAVAACAGLAAFVEFRYGKRCVMSNPRISTEKPAAAGSGQAVLKSVQQETQKGVRVAVYTVTEHVHELLKVDAAHLKNVK